MKGVSLTFPLVPRRCGGEAGRQVRLSRAEELPEDALPVQVTQTGAEARAGKVRGLWQRQQDVPHAAPLGVRQEIQFP